MRTRAEFLRVQRHGARWQTEHFVMYALSSPEFDRPKLGVTVSRRLGGAVIRNRLKRQVRECFRLELRPMIHRETMLVVIARAGAGGLETPTIKAELEAATLGLRKRLKAR